MWGTDYIAILFFLGYKVSRTTIKNPTWQLSGEIIQVTFRKSSTSLVQQLKKKLCNRVLTTMQFILIFSYIVGPMMLKIFQRLPE